jgi:hypothetical protein
MRNSKLYVFHDTDLFIISRFLDRSQSDAASEYDTQAERPAESGQTMI